MKLVLTMAAAALLMAGCYREHSAGHPVPSVPAASDEFAVNSDGTIRVTGIVLENTHSCVVDGICLLRLQLRSRDVYVIYGPADGEPVTHVRETTHQEWEIKKDDQVEVFGRYRKDRDDIEVFSSDRFYFRAVGKTNSL